MRRHFGSDAERANCAALYLAGYTQKQISAFYGYKSTTPVQDALCSLWTYYSDIPVSEDEKGNLAAALDNYLAYGDDFRREGIRERRQ